MKRERRPSSGRNARVGLSMGAREFRAERGANAGRAGPVTGIDRDFTGEADTRGDFANQVDYLVNSAGRLRTAAAGVELCQSCLPRGPQVTAGSRGSLPREPLIVQITTFTLFVLSPGWKIRRRKPASTVRFAQVTRACAAVRAKTGLR